MHIKANVKKKYVYIKILCKMTKRENFNTKHIHFVINFTFD